MPLYEYQCDTCGHRFEVIQKFSDAPIDTCQRCSGTVRKLLSSPAIQFKGSGWYITDYARAGKSDASAASSGEKSEPSSAATEAKAEGKSELKSENAASAPKASTSE